MQKQLEETQALINKNEKFKSRSKDKKKAEAAEKARADENVKLQKKVDQLQQQLQNSQVAVEQRVQEQGTVQEVPQQEQPTQEPIQTKPVEQNTEAELQAKQSLADETEGDGVKLIDTGEAKGISDAVDKLNATYSATEGTAAGLVTLPKGVLTGITAMLRSSNLNPAVRAYKDGTAEIDPEYMTQYADQMRDIYQKAMKVAELKATFNTQSANWEKKKDLWKTEPGDSTTLRKPCALPWTSLSLQLAGKRTQKQSSQPSRCATKETVAVNNLARFAPKGRLLGKTGKSQTKNQFELEEALDINLSSAFKDFKDGTLGDFDAIRQGATRDNFRQREANALSTPLTEANAASGVIGVLERVAPTFKNDPVTGKQSGGNVLPTRRRFLIRYEKA